MTLTDAPMSAPLAALARTRPVWRSYGGGGLALGGTVLLAATIVEWVAYAEGADDGVLLLAYGIAFVAALSVLAVATLPLAFGATGRDGVVGASTVGRIALVGYGWAFLASQIALLFATFALAPDAASAARTTSLVLSLVQAAAGIAAAVIVFRAEIATGLARVSLGVSVVIGIVAGVIAGAGAPLELMMLAFCASAVSIALVGLTYVSGPASVRRRTGGGLGEIESRTETGW
jgi:hypothetical protein